MQPSAGMNWRSGKRFLSWWMRAHSVATMKVRASGWRCTAASIPEVEHTSSARTSTSSRHSGWAITAARGFRHETDAAQDDRATACLLGLERHAERVPDEIGRRLDLGQLVIVGQEDGVSFPRQGPDRLDPAGGRTGVADAPGRRDRFLRN